MSQITKDAKAKAKAVKEAAVKELLKKDAYSIWVAKAALDLDRLCRNTA